MTIYKEETVMRKIILITVTLLGLGLSACTHASKHHDCGKECKECAAEHSQKEKGCADCKGK